MPLTRYLVRNEYGLADPEMYRSADKDDPEALLEGVAMAGLVGLLRQLGDLAEFAAEIFHDLHEEVMATAARGHGLMVRIQQLEAEFPPIEKALLLQTNHSLYYSNSGVEWHPNLQMKQNLIACGDLPRFVMDSYEESRGPPRLFLLDKFDVAGAGACLKRYTDPSFFKVETLPDSLPTMEVQREKKVRKTKKKGARWRNGETPETIPASHAKLHQLFMEDRIENAYNDPTRRVKLKKRPLDGSPFDSKNGKSYMEKFVESSSPESKTICEVSVVPLSLQWKQDDINESGLEVAEVSAISPVKDMLQANGRDVSSPNGHTDDLEDFEPITNEERDEASSTSPAAVEEKEIMFNGDGHREDNMDGYHSDEITSEVENYLDALATIESEIETDNDSRSRHNTTLLDFAKCGTDSDANEDMELQTDTLGSLSVGNSASEDGNSSFEISSSSMCTDGASSIGAGAQFVGDRFSKMIPPSDSNITDSGKLPDDQLTLNKGPFGMESKVLTVSMNTGMEADAVCGIGVGSQTSSSANLEHTCVPLNAGSWSSVGSEQDGTSTDCTKHANGLSYSDEARAIVVDSSTVASDNVPNQTDNLATLSIKHLPVDELEDKHSNGCPIDMEHSSDNLELTSESKSRNEAPDAGGVAESCNGILLKMDSPQSRLSLEEQHQCSPHAGENASADHSSSVSLSGDSDDKQASGAGDEVDDAMASPVVDLEKATVSAEEQQVHNKDQKLLREAINVGNLLDLDLQHKGGDEAICRTLDGENIDSLTCNMEASGGELGDSIHPDIPYAGSDVVSESGELTLIRVSLNNSSAILDELNILQDQKYLGKTQKFPLHEDNLPEVDIQKERSCKVFTQDGENKDSLTCNFEAVGVTTSLVSSDGDDAMVGDLVTQGVQTGVDNSHPSVVEVGVVPQERVDFYEAMSPGWNNESGLEEKVNEGEVAHADLDPTSAADWDSMAHGDNNTAVGSNDSFLTKQTLSEFVCNIRTTPTDLEPGNVDHAVLRLENVVSSQSFLPVAPAAASEESPKLLVNEPAVRSHLTDGDISKSLNLEAEQVPSLDLLKQEEVFVHKSEAAPEDGSGLKEEAQNIEFQPVPSLDLLEQEEVFVHKSEAAPEDGSGLQEEAQNIEFQQVTGATQLLHCQNEVQSPNSLNQEKEQGSENLLENFSIPQPSLTESLQEPMLDTGVHNFCLLSEVGEVNLLEMPPMPPLPPVQWRIGKPQNALSSQEMNFPWLGLGLFPPLQPSLADENPASEAGAPLSHNPFLSPVLLETENPDQSCVLQMLPTLGDPGNNSDDMVVKPLTSSLSPEPTFSEPSEQYYLASDTKATQGSPQPQSLGGDITSNPHPGPSVAELALSVEQPLSKTDTKINNLQHDTENADREDSSNLTDVRHELQNPPNTMKERAGSTDQQALLPKNEGGKPSGTLTGNIPRPPKPLIEAVAAHDRSKLRKVAERVRPQLAPKLEERDSLLEQIRTKSFNLKPATVSRPNIQQGPKTNLNVAAILEKANAIRQALAGSDEDDDADSWSE